MHLGLEDTEASCPHCGSKYSPQALIVHAVRAPSVGVELSDDLVLIQQIHTAKGIGARTGVKLVMCEAQWQRPFDLSPTFPPHRQKP